MFYGLPVIYDYVTRIEARKGKHARVYHGKDFYHDFRSPYPAMYAIPAGTKIHVPGEWAFTVKEDSLLITGSKSLCFRQSI